MHNSNNDHLLYILWCSAGFTECLIDRPTGRKYVQPLHHAEQISRYYNVNRQCQLSFGKDYAICPFMVRERIEYNVERIFLLV